jgi:acyl-CoA synthetase (AMP-forming)/AMP-acid ligase II
MHYKTRPDGEGSLPEGQGQLYVSSPTILHSEEIIGGVRKKTVLSEDGYYPTGDIASRSMRPAAITSKVECKDTIIASNGENVYPDEIEFYFKDIKHVVNDVVLGVKEWR